MNRYDDDPEINLDRIVSDIREDEASPEVVSGAAGRIWARLSGAGAEEGAPDASAAASTAIIRGCAGFTALMPAYVAKTLPAARALLVEDHVRDCAPCRAALESARGRRPSAKVVPFGTPAGAPRSTERATPRRSFSSRVVFAAAAAAVLGIVGLGAWLQYGRGGVNTAQVHSVRGALYRVTDGAAVPIAEGASFRYGEDVRTAKDSGAVIRLADGSLVEMGERAELSLASGGGDTTINLPRGNIIVQATKRASGHLFVRSEDALVAVTGTIFSVSRGTMGTRVSVIEGEVHVDRAGAKDVLHPGQQVTTRASLTRVPVEQDIAWSQDVDKYVALLSEIQRLRDDLSATSLTGELRHSTKLLNAQPAATMFYAAIPNVSSNLAEANRKIQEHVSQSEILRQWWEQHHGAEDRAEIQEILDKVRDFGSHLGDEVTVSLQMGEDNEPSGVLVMSEVKAPEAFRAFLAGEIVKVNAQANHGATLRILPDDLAQAGPDGAKSFVHDGPSEVVLWIHGDRVVAASSVGLVREAAASIDHPGTGGFASSSFGQRIAESYRDGAGWLFAVDMEKVVARASRDVQAETDGNGEARSAALQESGLLDAKQFILEMKETGDKTVTRGVLSFGQERRGIASWLASPAPMGALDFMSPDATMMAAFVVKEPVLLVDDLYGVLSAADPDFRSRLAQFESESGLSFKDDLAAPLGGEFAFALDGPVLPTPSWKAVMEVYDPPRLQHTLETIVAKLAEKAAQSGGEVPVPVLEREDAGGRTFYAIRAGLAAPEFHYVYVDGYLVAGPSRALLERAIQNKESGYVLTSSRTFRELLPQDGHVNFSALVYQNVGPLLKPIAQQMGKLTPDQQASVAALESQAAPSLAFAYGEQDRIIVATNGAGNLASQLGGGIVGLHGGDAGIAKLFQSAIEKQAKAAADGARSSTE